MAEVSPEEAYPSVVVDVPSTVRGSWPRGRGQGAVSKGSWEGEQGHTSVEVITCRLQTHAACMNRANRHEALPGTSQESRIVYNKKSECHRNGIGDENAFYPL